MISEEQKQEAMNWLNGKVDRILSELGASNIDEGLRILDNQNGK